MIKLFIYENYNNIIPYFQEEDHNIPFLGSNLFDFTVSSYKRFSDSLDQNIEIYITEVWSGSLDLPTYKNINEHFRDEHDLYFFTDLFTVPISDFSLEDYHFLSENPGKLFSHEHGLKMGFLNKDSDVSRLYTEELSGFSNLVKLSISNFLKVNQTLVSNFSSNVVIPGNYGNPVVLADSDNIVNSRILGPSFVGENAKIFNSVIYPGSVVTGNVTISGSEVFESFVCESTIKNSNVRNSFFVLSSVDELNVENSIFPRGSIINHVRKR